MPEDDPKSAKMLFFSGSRNQGLGALSSEAETYAAT